MLADKAAIFVDGRYTLQVEHEVDAARFSPQHVTDRPPGDWIAAHLTADGKLGYDPWLHTPHGAARLEAACARAGGRLVAIDDNPVDAVWTDQPAPPISPAVPHPAEYAGLSSPAKLAAWPRSKSAAWTRGPERAGFDSLAFQHAGSGYPEHAGSVVFAS